MSIVPQPDETGQGAAFERVLAAAENHDLVVDRHRTGRHDYLDAHVQCPAHPDSRNRSTLSMHVTDKGEGRVTLHCFGQKCTEPAMVDALGLTPADLFNNRRDVIYVYEDGRVVHRRPGKTFVQSGTKKAKGGALYRSERVRTAVAAGHTVYVVEGEADVHAVEAAGGVATCSAMGAGKWDKADDTILHNATRVVVVQDADPSGHAHAQQVVESLLDHVQRVEVVEAKQGKDAADHLGYGHGLDDFVLIAEPRRRDLLAGMRDGPWLWGQVFPPMDWVVPDLIPEGASLLVGAPKSGKSWLSLGLALAVADGGTVLGGIQVEQRPVFLLALEDGDRRMQARCNALLNYGKFPAWFAYQTIVEPGLIFATVAEWLKRIPESFPPPFVIIDTLGKVMPPSAPGESDYQRDYRIGSALKRVSDERRGMGLFVLHHDRKAVAEDFVHSVSGTNGIAGAFDTVLVLRRKRLEDHGLLQVTGRDVPEDEYAITTEHGAWSLDGTTLRDAAEKARESRDRGFLGERSHQVLEDVQNFPSGVRPSEVAERLDMSAQTAGVYLGRLLDKGLLARPSRGVYQAVVSVGSDENEEARVPASTLLTNTTPTTGEQ